MLLPGVPKPALIFVMTSAPPTGLLYITVKEQLSLLGRGLKLKQAKGQDGSFSASKLKEFFARTPPAPMAPFAADVGDALPEKKLDEAMGINSSCLPEEMESVIA